MCPSQVSRELCRRPSSCDSDGVRRCSLSRMRKSMHKTWATVSTMCIQYQKRWNYHWEIMKWEDAKKRKKEIARKQKEATTYDDKDWRNVCRCLSFANRRAEKHLDSRQDWGNSILETIWSLHKPRNYGANKHDRSCDKDKKVQIDIYSKQQPEAVA